MEYVKSWNQDESQTESGRTKNLEILGSGQGHIIPNSKFTPHAPQAPHTPHSRPTGRPPSRARSAKRRVDMFRAAEDPDGDNTEAILAQMEQVNQAPRDLPMYTGCDCVTRTHSAKQDTKQSPEPTVESYGDEDSNSDNEGEVDVSVLLAMLRKLKDTPLRRTSNRAFLTLVSSLETASEVDSEQVQQILGYLADEVIVEVQDLALGLIKQLCFHRSNTTKFMVAGLLNNVEKILLSMRPLKPYVAAVGVLEAIVSHEEFLPVWLEPVMRVLPGLMRHLQIEETVDAKYAICCLFRRLAQYPELSWNIQNEAIPVIDVTKGNSAKMSEVYTQVMMEAVQHSDEVSIGLIQNGALPTATKILQDGPCGPQKHALALLSALTKKNLGIASTIDDEDLMTLVLRCIKETKCRHVCAEATCVLANTFMTRSRGRCRDLMVHIADYLVPATMEIELLQAYSLAGDSQKLPLIRNRHERETQLWNGLHKLCHVMCDIICKEAKVDLDGDGCPQRIGLTASSTSGTPAPGVSVISQCVRVLTNVCIWAASKSRHDFYKIDLHHFAHIESQRLKLSKLNRVLTHFIWDIAGRLVSAVMAQFSSQLRRLLVLADLLYDTKMRMKQDISGSVVKKGTSQRLLVERAILRNGTVDLSKMFVSAEIHLIKVCLDFLLCMSLCTCREFPNLQKHETPPGSDSNRINSNNKATTNGRPPSGVLSNGRPPSSKKENGWVNNNTEKSSKEPNTEDGGECDNKPKQKQNTEQNEQGLAMERRNLRRNLYEAGVFYCVTPLLSASDQLCQVLACQILRCNIQPVEEKILFPSSKATRRRPKSAVNRKDMEKKLNVALHQMSPDFAVIIKEAIGPRPGSAHPAFSVSSGSGETDDTMTVSSTSGDGIDDQGTAARLAEYMEQSKKTEKIKKSVDFGIPVTGPTLDPRQPMGQQCRQLLVKEAGHRVISGVFTAPKSNRRHFISLIYDIVHLGDHELHMKLAEFGCMQKLLDFIRVNTDSELLEIIGLIIVQMLIKSDPRLRQIFDRHGGTRLMMTMMSKYSSGPLRDEIKNTMRTVSSTGITAGPSRAKPSDKGKPPPDVWDQIQSSWKDQDKVKTVLRNWRSDVKK
ncbi:uncharacterized protein LOC110465705 [Mizuhopecten yessoensis]|uniref:Uncharacterized protein n=2 Tax=Mizuhopecten yessoensis TaxID=6573 RepID=A0A210PR52_MIZYE|nr:uncharacterized protein LOC110465705 [Mizuhopecten yessoensis]XP_021377382.1 uncharacterized protein LOC110465705 [Mizuhopecten yessoensis]OWF38922.1 hypothetical protein KP79_PYT07597 [Mizuhopecten yessoensis]